MRRIGCPAKEADLVRVPGPVAYGGERSPDRLLAGPDDMIERDGKELSAISDDALRRRPIESALSQDFCGRFHDHAGAVTAARKRQGMKDAVRRDPKRVAQRT